MKKSMRAGSVVKGAVAALVVAAAGTAAAAESGFYLTGGLGQATTDFGSEESEAFDEIALGAFEATEATVSNFQAGLDKSGLGYELAVGYQFNKYVAVEAAYVDAGDAAHKATATLDGSFDATSEVKFGVKGPAVTVIGMLPLAHGFSLDARVGALFGKSRVVATVSVEDEEQSEPIFSDSKTTVAFGAGASWSFSEKTAVRLGYSLAPKGLADEWDVSNLALTLRYGF